MKMTLNKVLEHYKNLAQLAEKKLPVKLSYAITKNLVKLQAEAELIEKSRLDLINQYAEKNEDGEAKIKEDGTYSFGENRELFLKEYNDYLNTETDLDVYTVDFMELEKLENDRYDALSVAEIASLEFVLKENEEG